MANAAARTRQSFVASGLKRQLQGRVVTAMNRAVAYLAEAAKQSLSGSQSTISFGRYRWGTNPSLPGSPPKKVSGALASSIETQVMQQTQTRVIGRVGTNERKAKSLEYGATIPSRRARKLAMVFAATKRIGQTSVRESAKGVVFRRYVRGFTLRPRPWLAPLITKHTDAVMAIFRNAFGNL